MTAIEFLMNELNVPEFESERDEFTQSYLVISTIMENYHNHKQKLLKHDVSGKLTDEEIWQWVEWIDKRCAFNDHQKDYIYFAIRQILKSEACASGAVDKTVSDG